MIPDVMLLDEMMDLHAGEVGLDNQSQNPDSDGRYNLLFLFFSRIRELLG